MIPKSVASAIIVLVTIIWAANFGAQFVVADYRPDVSINGIFMGIVGGALIVSRKSSKAADPPKDSGTPGVPPPPEPPAPPEPPPAPSIPAGKEALADMLERLARQARGEK